MGKPKGPFVRVARGLYFPEEGAVYRVLPVYTSGYYNKAVKTGKTRYEFERYETDADIAAWGKHYRKKQEGAKMQEERSVKAEFSIATRNAMFDLRKKAKKKKWTADQLMAGEAAIRKHMDEALAKALKEV